MKSPNSLLEPVAFAHGALQDLRQSVDRRTTGRPRPSIVGVLVGIVVIAPVRRLVSLTFTMGRGPAEKHLSLAAVPRKLRFAPSHRRPFDSVGLGASSFRVIRLRPSEES